MNEIRFRPGAKAPNTVRALNSVVTDLGGVGGTSDPMGPFLNWANAAERQLVQTLELESIDYLIRTPGYWALCGAAFTLPTMQQAVSTETERQQVRLRAILEGLEASVRRWSQSGDAEVIVTDTNLLMGYKEERDFEEVDWLGVLGVSRLRIVVPIAVMHELDRLKRGSDDQRRRARRAAKWLRAELPPPESPAASAWVTGTDDKVSVEVLKEMGKL